MNQTITLNQLYTILDNANSRDCEFFINGHEYTYGIHKEDALVPVSLMLPVVDFENIKEIFVVGDTLEIHINGSYEAKKLEIKERVNPLDLI